MHIFADVFGIPAVAQQDEQRRGLGSAICAAVGKGVYGSWDEAIENMVSWEPAFAPDEANHDLYQAMSAVYDQIPGLTDKIFESPTRSSTRGWARRVLASPAGCLSSSTGMWQRIMWSGSTSMRGGSLDSQMPLESRRGQRV